MRKRRLFPVPTPVRVTPDPEQAAELERRRAELAYRPENGFLLEREQERVPSLLRKQAS